jgi:hypothetical protein
MSYRLVLLFLISSFAVKSEEKSDIQDLKLRNLGQEYLICGAYYDVTSGCLKNSSKNDLAIEYEKFAGQSIMIAHEILDNTRMNREAQKSFYGIQKKDFLNKISGRCENISIIMAEKSSNCEDMLLNVTQKTSKILN